MPVDSVPLPEGRVRMYRVQPLIAKTGRSVGKSTTLATQGLHMLEAFQRGEPIGWERMTDWVKNQVLYEWGALVGNLLLRKGLNYGIAGMYIEFENVTNPGDPVTPPTLTRNADEGVSYYNELIASTTRDYLRVPLIAGALNSTDDTKFPKGNAPTFFCQTSGVVGVHGKPFGDTYNSTVYGGALVAFVDNSDYTQDLVLSRFYLDADKQQIKLPTSQVGVEWELKLK